MSVNIKSLIGKLNDTTRNTMQAAAGFCLQRTHYDVEIEHFLMKLLEHSGGDLAAIVKAFDIDKAKLSAQLTASLDKLKSGGSGAWGAIPMPPNTDLAEQDARTLINWVLGGAL